MIARIIVVIIGVGSGIVVATGLLSFVISLGLVSKMSQRTNTVYAVQWYKDMVALGGVIGSVIYIFQIDLSIGYLLLPVFGISTGIFIGGWALSIAEVINIIPVFVRRFHMARFLKYIVLTIAVGKAVGSIFLFITE